MGCLEGTIGIVTGAGNGIGRATALLAAAEGAAVVVADIRAAAAARTVADITARGGVAIASVTDIADAAQVADMVARAGELGGLHWACNNAYGGGGAFKPFTEIRLADWNSALAVTLTGTFLCMQHEAAAMRVGGGSIVNITTVAAYKGEAFLAAYAAAKGGVEALTKTAAAELAQAGIRVNSICPGGIETESLGRYFAAFPEFRERTVATHAMRRLGKPEEVAEAVVFLASRRSAFVTGHALFVDGGTTVNSHLL